MSTPTLTRLVELEHLLPDVAHQYYRLVLIVGPIWTTWFWRVVRPSSRTLRTRIARRLERPLGSIGPTRVRCLKKLARLFAEQGGDAP